MGVQQHPLHRREHGNRRVGQGKQAILQVFTIHTLSSHRHFCIPTPEDIVNMNLFELAAESDMPLLWRYAPPLPLFIPLVRFLIFQI